MQELPRFKACMTLTAQSHQRSQEFVTGDTCPPTAERFTPTGASYFASELGKEIEQAIALGKFQILLPEEKERMSVSQSDTPH
jgi:hypothetical protein